MNKNVIKHLIPIETKIIGILTFKTETPIHIGSIEAEVRRSFLKLKNEVLVIPSSSWKGTFRAISENIAKTMNFNGIAKLSIKYYNEDSGGIRYIPKTEEEDFNKLKNELIELYKGLKKEAYGISKEQLKELIYELGFKEEEKELEKELDENENKVWTRFTEAILAINCPIGKLYGNGYLASKLRFSDSFIKSKTNERPGIAIDRESGKVREGHLYFIEILPKAKIKLMFIACNLRPGEEDSQLFANTLNYISELGITIGGGKSRGLGYLLLDDANIYIADLRNKDFTEKIQMISNPLKYVKPVKLDDFIEWLRYA
ncbi:MAG: RAMP superfamily CRISPR-associated protein [Candidatus Methanomethylicia archaeon]|nr:RAMP superfamily CRISPR-associated protein [Candidatus Methanomethylicia archaeon]